MLGNQHENWVSAPKQLSVHSVLISADCCHNINLLLFYELRKKSSKISVYRLADKQLAPPLTLSFLYYRAYFYPVYGNVF